MLEQNKIEKQVNQVFFKLTYIIIHCTHYLSSHWLREPTANFGNQSYLQIS